MMQFYVANWCIPIVLYEFVGYMDFSARFHSLPVYKRALPIYKRGFLHARFQI